MQAPSITAGRKQSIIFRAMLFATNGELRPQITPFNGSNGDRSPNQPSADSPLHHGKLNRQQKKRNKKIRHGTRMAAKLLDKLVMGEPMVTTGTKLESRLKIMIDNMEARGLVPEDSSAYYDDSLSGRSKRQVERDISFNPLPEHLVHSRSKIEAALGTQGSRAVHVMGAGTESPASDSSIFQEAGLVIAVPGGLRTARQMMHYAAQRYQNPNLPPIIIENTGKFWDPLLKIAGVMTENGQTLTAGKEAADALGIYVTHGRLETIGLARRLMAERGIEAQNFSRVETILPPSSEPAHLRRITAFQATRTAKKTQELQTAARAQGFNLEIRPIDQLVDFYVAPDEDRNSYQAHGAIKALSGLAAWKKMPAEARARSLGRLGLKEENCVIIGEDSGVWFKEPNLQQEPEFASIRHLIPDGANFPGVETGPTIWGGGGVPDFIGRARQAIVRRATLRDMPPNFEVGNVSLLAMVPLAPNAKGEHPLTVTFAHRNMRIATEPEPAPVSNVKDYDLCDFLYPRHGMTPERQIRGWVKQSGPRAGALRALAVALQAGAAQPVPEAKIGANYMAGIFVPDGHEPKVKREFRSERRKLTAKVNPYPAIIKLSDVQERVFAPHDGIALSFDNPKAPDDYARRFITYGYVFFSGVVAQQTGDKFMLGKMLAVLDDKRQAGEDKILDRLEAMTYDLHRLGAIPQEPHTLFKRFGSVLDLAYAMNAAKKEVFRYPPFSYADGPNVITQSGTPSSKDYHTSLLLTASLKGTDMLAQVEPIARTLAEGGSGIVTGAGLNNGGMGLVTQTLYDMAMRGKDVHHTGITTPHIREHEASGNIEKRVQHFVLTKNIHVRKEGLSRSDSNLLLPGGAGTLEEGFADLFMMMQARASKDPALELYRHNQLVVVNTPIVQDGRKRGFYDVVLANMPERVLQDYPIHVTGTVNGAVDAVVAHRSAMRAAGRRTGFTTDNL